MPSTNPMFDFDPHLDGIEVAKMMSGQRRPTLQRPRPGPNDPSERQRAAELAALSRSVEEHGPAGLLLHDEGKRATKLAIGEDDDAA